MIDRETERNSKKYILNAKTEDEIISTLCLSTTSI
jgi:hypothetical protein